MFLDFTNPFFSGTIEDRLFTVATYGVYSNYLPNDLRKTGKNEDIPMSEELKNAGCSASDCASCCDSSCSGCGSSDEEHRTITLTMDDNTEVECAILTIFPVEDKEYIALLPLDENGENEDGEVYIYRYDNSTGTPQLENIEDDDEYEAVADAFDEMLDAAEYDELVDAEDVE